MKKLILTSLVFMFIAPAVVFYVNGGRVKSANLTLKQDRGSLTVRPAGVVIKPQ